VNASRSAPIGFARASPFAPPAIASIAALPAGMTTSFANTIQPRPSARAMGSPGNRGGSGWSSFTSSLMTIDSNTGRSSTSRTGTRPIGDTSRNQAGLLASSMNWTS